MSERFSDTVALVAGGTGALGRAVSQAFLAEGATVIATYRSPGELGELTRDVTGAGGAPQRLEGQRIDVTDPSATQTLVREIVSRHARIDVLVNAVGGYTGGEPAWRVEPADLERMLSLNLRAGYALARAVVPVMLAQNHGCIVNVIAKAALEHPARASAYAASKAAALAMMGSLAAELSGSAVRANSVLPSVIDTAANRSAMPKADFSRWPKPADIARVILFLCSEDARVIRGAAIPVYGGH
jgi:NAD(P)-dependent dehydrogenase (short-subunit alcohol dehydrogenase family)